MPKTVQRRNTRQRQLVLDAVRSRYDHPTAEQIFAAVHELDPHISKGTVYRNLHLLVDEGAIRSVRVPGSERFDLRMDDHAHLICGSCGALVDVFLPKNPNLEDQVKKTTGYVVSSHYIMFEGLCPECQALAEQSA